jgi:hypothetical protein
MEVGDEVTPQEKQLLLKQILVGNGVVGASASDAEVQQAYAALQQSDPQRLNAMLKAGGYPVIPWLTIIGLGAGLVAAYFIWKQYQKPTVVDAVEYPDTTDQIRAMGRSLGRFQKFGRPALKGCRPRRLGAADEKYEFEPEIRLEGIRRKKARRAS